jgi:methylglutaconyl-CoA hydratase
MADCGRMPARDDVAGEVMDYETIIYGVDARGIAYLTLNRPEVHNAMNSRMWDEGLHAVQAAEADPKVRALVISGNGKSFCAGGDLKYQLAQRDAPRTEKISEAGKLATWLQALDLLSKPVIGRIQGPAYAGGIGLISVCDIALGLIPAMISPYVIRRMGAAKARRYFLNARRFDAREAVALGVLDRAVPASGLDAAVEEEIALVLQCAPGAVATIKKLIDYVDSNDVGNRIRYTVGLIADMWDDPEAIEGLSSFGEKRKPEWAVAAAGGVAGGANT